MKKSAEDLVALLKKMFTAAGANDHHAGIVADHLVASELAGVETHGLRPLWLYFRDIRDGQLLPSANPEILEESETSALISGSWTFGHVAAKFGMEVAMEKAAKSGIAIVSLVQLHHIGRVGHYAEMAAGAGMCAIVTGAGYCMAERRAAPYGGRETLLDTNPITMGFPNPAEPDGRPMLLDYATTTRAHGALFLAKLRGQELQPGFVIDKKGNPSTDPNVLDTGGALLPFGSYKGYSLMMAVEFLARLVSGSDDHIDPNRGEDMFRHQGVTMIVLKANLFRSMANYTQGAHEMAQQTRAIAPAPGFDQVRMPGDPEADTRATRKRDGIPIAEDIWKMLTEQATTLGLDIRT
jgi:LDH2 family malate/lactate/ureidoglycolate dehydrogenase